MTINFKRTRQYLEAFDFKKLFVEELGWGRAAGAPTPLTLDGATYRLSPLAELGGMRAYLCEGGDGLPTASARKKIATQVRKLAEEHILIFVDTPRTTATWQWVKREAGASAKPREHNYQKGQPGDSLLQKLSGIAFRLEDLDEEGRASIADVVGKVKKAFDVERVTKRFYDEFKTEHDALLKFITGIDEATERAWYASVMLNRLMFIYFIQKKGFLDNNPDYLRSHLLAMPARDRFYRDFLTPLFFEGFAQEASERSSRTRSLLGNIPYLNGGLFQPHPLEQAHGKHLDIPDKVFERLFAFFDGYTWHLDDRPRKADNEINPDVLGYIFEKYINQKQMGAYYTKEDITGYICRNTILPFLFDKLVTLRFGKLDHLPMDDVEPYIYPAVKQSDYLPTETEREYAARQKRLAQIRADFAAGKIAGIADLITYNLDSERFMRDWLGGLRDPATLQTFYFDCLSKLTVLDPTVGSGAFLFAAMNILEPLYEIALDQMSKLGGPKYPRFREELARVAQHPNRRYFIYKSIIVNNLYGVDIMDEAVEICKLRLFLKLVAQVDDANQIEPLPDIDFNIRAGNTLVGYASLEEVEQAAATRLFSMNLMQTIKEADIALRSFRALQTTLNIGARQFAQAKEEAKATLGKVDKELNESLAAEYGARSLDKFVGSHKPFHWYVEFNQIMQEGGFDVIVGNPPYVESRVIESQYRLRGYETGSCNNLFAYVAERAVRLIRISGRFGFIVPLSSMSTEKFAPLQSIVLRQERVWLSHFDDRPARLFEGLEHIQLTIILYTHSAGSVNNQRIELLTTRCHKWSAEERQFLFHLLTYARPQKLYMDNSVPKVGSAVEVSILDKIWRGTRTLGNFLVPSSKHVVYYTRKVHAFLNVLDFVPAIKDSTGRRRDPSEQKILEFDVPIKAQASFCVLNSTLFRWFLTTHSDCRNLNRREVLSFPVDLEKLCTKHSVMLSRLAVSVSQNLRRTSEIRSMRFGGETLDVQCIIPKHSKPIIDEIDRVLAKHYGFTDEELDFIIHYDIKYRMGRGLSADNDNGLADE